jgi:hypothetical protein
MKKTLAIAVAIGISVFVAACGDGGKAAAEAAVTSAQTSFDAAKAGAAAYVPDQVKAVQDSLTSAKDSLAKGGYAQALADAQSLAPKISALGEAAAAKKMELTKSWESLGAGLPNVVSAIQSRVDMLSKSKKLPAGVSKEAFDGAKSGLSTLTQTWTEATEAFKGGNLVDALAKARAVKSKAAETMTALGMPVPDALK